jgi:hypothetical protein
VQFTRESADRIARVVRQVEDQVPSGAGLTFGAITESRQKKVFRVCTFTGAWSKNSFKTVTLKYVTSTPNTFVATNLFAEIASPSGAKNCAIAKDGTAWHLIAAEC